MLPVMPVPEYPLRKKSLERQGSVDSWHRWSEILYKGRNPVYYFHVSWRTGQRLGKEENGVHTDFALRMQTGIFPRSGTPSSVGYPPGTLFKGPQPPVPLQPVARR